MECGPLHESGSWRSLERNEVIGKIGDVEFDIEDRPFLIG
jgi:hypothetical protein